MAGRSWPAPAHVAAASPYGSWSSVRIAWTSSRKVMKSDVENKRGVYVLLSCEFVRCCLWKSTLCALDVGPFVCSVLWLCCCFVFVFF